MSDSKRERALIGTDALGAPIVLATDGAGILHDFDAVGTTDACLLGIVDSTDCRAPGFYLWEGASRVTDRGPDYEPEVEYSGALRRVETLEELTALHAMTPPFPEDDREEVQPGDAHLYRNGGAA